VIAPCLVQVILTLLRRGLQVSNICLFLRVAEATLSETRSWQVYRRGSVYSVNREDVDPTTDSNVLVPMTKRQCKECELHKFDVPNKENAPQESCIRVRQISAESEAVLVNLRQRLANVLQ
jgi:hypothetical protein